MVTGLGEIAEKLRRSTVVIQSGGRSSGSGVIWSSDGSIITNAHVARGMHAKIQLWDGREFDAAIASRDARRDLALLRIGAMNLPSVSVADSSQVRPGELAIGNPLGFVGALTTGVIHTVGPLRGLGSQSWVQADVRLAPGNSGGPLADACGYLIGINTMIAGRLASSLIPSNAVRDFLSTSPSDAWLGVTVHPVRIPRRSAAVPSVQSFGLLLCEVEPDSPASSASLMPGDILLGTEEQSFASLGDLAKILQGSGPRLLRLEFLRGDYSLVRRVAVQLGVQRSSRDSVAA